MAMETNMTVIPRAMLMIAILTIGSEKFDFSGKRILPAIKRSAFK
jgi:hypothetical protein